MLSTKDLENPPHSEPLMTTPIWTKSENVSVGESMRSPLHVLASKSTSFETVVTVETGSYRQSRYASGPCQLCRPEHQPMCSSSFLHDLLVIQLRGNVPKQSRIKPQWRERPRTCSKSSASTPPKKPSRPSAKNSCPFSQLVVLAFERLRLLIRCNSASPLFLL